MMARRLQKSAHCWAGPTQHGGKPKCAHFHRSLVEESCGKRRASRINVNVGSSWRPMVIAMMVRAVVAVAWWLLGHVFLITGYTTYL